MYLIKCSYTISSLSHTESLKDYDAKVNERFLIEDSCFRGVSWTVTFTMRGTQGGETLIKAGEVVAKNDWVTTSFTSRIWVLNNGIELDPVRVTDVGTYKFSDPQGNLAHVATLTVHPGEQQHILFIRKEKCINKQ